MDENQLRRWEERLKNVLLPNESKTPCLMIAEHYFSELIVSYFHSILKHISTKQALTEIWQKFWICYGISFLGKF